MKKLLPQTEPEAPRQRIAVEVPSLMPEWFLWNTATSEVKRVFGGNPTEDSVYTEGEMPKEFRLAEETESYQDELLFLPLPNNIEETVLSESPECKLVLMNCKVVELPAEKPKAECVVRPMYPTAKVIRMLPPEPEPEPVLRPAAKKTKRKVTTPPDPKQFTLTFDFNYNQLERTG